MARPPAFLALSLLLVLAAVPATVVAAGVESDFAAFAGHYPELASPLDSDDFRHPAEIEMISTLMTANPGIKDLVEPVKEDQVKKVEDTDQLYRLHAIEVGSKQYPEVHAMAVCDDEPTFERRIAAIVAEARALDPSLREPVRVRVDARFKGPAYAVSTPAQRARMAEATRLSGLCFDPVYTGKAFFGLWELCRSGAMSGKRLLFLHTGGLPGLLAQADAFAPELPKNG